MARELKRKRGLDALPSRRKLQLSTVTAPHYEHDKVMDDFEGLETLSGSGDDASDSSHEGASNVDEVSAGNHDTGEVASINAAASDHGKPRVPPSGEEVRVMKDASELYKSSSFKLKIDALLPNVRPKPSRIPPLERFLLALHTLLTALPSTSPCHPLEAATKLRQLPRMSPKKPDGSHVVVQVPYPEPKPNKATNWKVAFAPPTDITLVGSWGNKMSVKGKNGKRFTVDVAVEMPAMLFQEKDYLDCRFFHKRAFYLASLASAIANDDSAELNVDVLYHAPFGNTRMTTLLLRPRGGGSSTDFSKLNADVRIIPALPQDSPIPLSRLSPTHSNLRPATTTSDPPTPTPFYNTDILRSLAIRHHLLSSHDAKIAVPAFADALTLLKVWANQRGYGGAEGEKCLIHGFEDRGYWWSSLLELLILGEESAPSDLKGVQKRKPLGKGLSSYQLFRAALDFIVRHDFAVENAFTKSSEGYRFPSDHYRSCYRPVFIDSWSLVNVLAGVPLSSLDMLRHDARTTLDQLDSASASDDAFHTVFLQDHCVAATRFDILIRFNLPSLPRKANMQEVLDTGSSFDATVNAVCAYLRRGLGDRARAVAVMHQATQPRPVSDPERPTSSELYIGLILNPEHTFRLVDLGPSADDQNQEASQRFRDFWGEKAELRRFKDGRIMESVVWEVRNADERSHVPIMVVQHLLLRHFDIKSTITWQTDFDALLRLPKSVSAVYQTHGIAGGFKACMADFDALTKALKGLDQDLPLGIVAIHPSSPYLRYSSALSPVPRPPSLIGILPDCAMHLPSTDIVIEFEKSGRWPDDLKAIQKIKLAFLEQLATAFMKAHSGASASVVIDPNAGQIDDQAKLEIVTAAGWAYSARIWHDREGTLLDRIIDTRSHVRRLTQAPLDHEKARERRQALAARDSYLRRYIHAPRHHRAITTLSHKYSAFSGTVRLVKRWFASHWLLDAHASEEAVELLCARVFLGSDGPSEIPGSKERGFACVISLLRDWTWENGLIVPMLEDDDLRSKPLGLETVTTGSFHTAWRLFTATDPSGRIWTSCGPDVVVARRIRTLAQATYRCLQGMDRGLLDVKALFTHPTDDYDMLLELRASVLPRYAQNVIVNERAWTKDTKYSNLQSLPSSTSSKLVDFDPAALLRRDLQYIYADTFKLFHDPLGGDRFGIVWDPSLRMPRSFRVMGGYSFVPARKEERKAEKGKSDVMLNELAIINELKRLGDGLIESITVQT